MISIKIEVIDEIKNVIVLYLYKPDASMNVDN